LTSQVELSFLFMSVVEIYGTTSSVHSTQRW